MTVTMHVLIIEKTVDRTADLAAALDAMGCLVATTEDWYPEMVEPAQRQKPDVVLVHVALLDRATWEAAEKIQAELFTPVIIVASESGSDIVDWNRSRPCGYLVEPFDPTELKAMIDLVIYSQGLENSLRDCREHQTEAAANEIRTGEERFRTIADFTYDWEYWMAPDGTFHWVSPSCERITGCRPDEFYKDPNLFFKITHPDDRLVMKNFLKETNNVKFIHLDYRIVRRDGQVRWISHNSQSVYGTDGAWQGRRGSNRDVTGRKEVEEQLLDYQRQLRSLASELVLAEQRERRSIAVDLHDRVGHTLAMAQIKLNQLQMVNTNPELSRLLDEATGLVEESISDTRSLTLEISPPALYELGLEAALDELAQEIQDEQHIRTEVVDDGQPKPMGEDAKVALYRATRELMINAVKHSQSPYLRVTLSRAADRIVVEVIDQGRGFDPARAQTDAAKTKSFGLFSIRERLRHMNGEIKIDSRPGQGTRVTLTMPLES